LLTLIDYITILAWRCSNVIIIIISARQHNVLSRYYAIARPSARLSVCLSHGWISQKRLKLGSCNFHHEHTHDSTSPTVNFTAKFHREHMEHGC